MKKTLLNPALPLALILSLFILYGCSSDGSVSGKTLAYDVSSTGDSITSAKLKIEDGKLIATLAPIINPVTGNPYGEDDIDKMDLAASFEDTSSSPKFSPVPDTTSMRLFTNYKPADCSSKFAFGEGTSSSADVAFIVDTTASMGTKVSGILGSIDSFAQTLSDAELDVKFAMVTLGDAYNTKLETGGAYDLIGSGANDPPTFDTVARPQQDFTDLTTFKTFSDKVKTVIGSGDDGGSGPENYFGAVMASAGLETNETGLSNREGVPFYMILIGDVYSYTSSGTDYQLESGGITEPWIPPLKPDVSKLAGNVTVHAVRDPDYDDQSSDDYISPAQIADATGGAKLDLGSTGDVDLTSLNLAEFITTFWLVTFSNDCVPSDPTTFTLTLVLTVTDSEGVTRTQTFVFTITLT